jgi:hypothetical protein
MMARVKEEGYREIGGKWFEVASCSVFAVRSGHDSRLSKSDVGPGDFKIKSNPRSIPIRKYQDLEAGKVKGKMVRAVVRKKDKRA